MQARISSLQRKNQPDTEDVGLLIVSGNTVPADASVGYQPGCIFQDTTNGAVYVNEGSATSSLFNKIASTTGPIVLDGVTTDDAIQVTGTYERALDFSSWTPGTTTDGVVLRVGSGIGTSALAMPDGARGLAIYLRNTGTSGTLTGMRLRTVCDPSATSNGANTLHVQAEVVASKNATTVNSGFFEVVPKGTNVIGTIRGILINLDSAASQTVSTQQTVLHCRLHTRGDETMSGTDEIVLLQNQAVGGNGRQVDSFIRCMETSMSGGIKSAGYLIDAGVGTNLLATAVLRLPDDEVTAWDDATGAGDSAAGAIKVVIGTAARYIKLYSDTP